MPLAKCARCGSIFSRMHALVCAKCEPDENRDADLIRDAVEKHPNLNAEQAAELTGVEIQVVSRLVEQGVIANVTMLEQVAIQCGRCGAPAISVSKRLCQGCLEKLNSEAAMARRGLRLKPKKKTELGKAGMKSPPAKGKKDRKT